MQRLQCWGIKQRAKCEVQRARSLLLKKVLIQSNRNKYAFLGIHSMAEMSTYFMFTHTFGAQWGNDERVGRRGIQMPSLIQFAVPSSLPPSLHSSAMMDLSFFDANRSTHRIDVQILRLQLAFLPWPASCGFSPNRQWIENRSNLVHMRKREMGGCRNCESSTCTRSYHL